MFILPVAYNLFGPVQNEGALKQAHSSTYGFAGAATTASTKTFWFNFGYPQIYYASFAVMWQSNTTANKVGFFSMDSGPINFNLLAEITGHNDGGIYNASVIVTDALNALREAGVMKHLGFRIAGDGVTNMTIYEVRLAIDWLFTFPSQALAEVPSAARLLAWDETNLPSGGIIGFERLAALNSQSALAAPGWQEAVTGAACSVGRQTDVLGGAAIFRPGIESPLTRLRYNAGRYNTNALTV